MMEKVGGDFFEYYFDPAKPRFAYACLGDVTGHGLPAAIVVAMASIGFQTFIKRGITEPEAILHQMNKHFFLILRRQKMMTFQVLKFDISSGEGTFSNAGQTPPLLMKPDGTSEMLFLAKYPLGSKKDIGDPFRS